MKKRMVTIICILFLIVLTMPIDAFAHNDLLDSNQIKKLDATEVDSLFDNYISEHPKYHYGLWIDINHDGIVELLLTELPNDLDWNFGALCAISEDGKSLISWSLFCQSLGYRYDPDMHTIITQSSGTGVNEFCAMKIDGNILNVRHVGRNCSSPDYEVRYFYDFTGEISGGEDVPVYYNFGEKPGPNHTLMRDLSILRDHALTEDEYRSWYDYFWNLDQIELQPIEELEPWESALNSSMVQQASVYEQDPSPAVNEDSLSSDPETWSNIKKVITCEFGSGIYGMFGITEDGNVLFGFASEDKSTLTYLDETEENAIKKCIAEVESWSGIEDMLILNCFGPNHTPSYANIIGLRKDGTVVSTWDTDYSAWSGITKIVSSSGHGGWVAGLRSDGTVVTTKKHENTELDGWNDDEWFDLSGWKNIVDIQPYQDWEMGHNGCMNGLIGLRSDGTVVGAFPQAIIARQTITEYLNKMQDIKQVCCTLGSVYGLKSDGTVMGRPDYDDNYELQGNYKGVRPSEWTDIVHLFPGYAYDLYGVRRDGTIIGSVDSIEAELLEDATVWRNIVLLDAGYRLLIGLTEDGKIVCSDHSGDVCTEGIMEWENVETAACVWNYVVAICENGIVKFTRDQN